MATSLVDELLQTFSNAAANISYVIEEETNLINGSCKQKYNVGDVIKVRLFKGKTSLKIQEKITRLARIRIINIPKEFIAKLATNNNDEKSHYLGVEYFNWIRKYNTQYNEFYDGFINGTKIFNVKKAGYGDFICSDQIVGCPLWTRSKSKKALKLKQFNLGTFIKAAHFGSIPVIKHMMKMSDYPSSKCDKNAIWNAINFNHYEITKLLFERHCSNLQQDDAENKENVFEHNNHSDDEYKLPKLRRFKLRRECAQIPFYSIDGRTKFYNPSLFDQLCRDSNLKMLQLLLEHDHWPIYHSKSYGLYQAVTSGNLDLVKLLLSHLHNAHYINLPMHFDKRQRTVIPQTNQNLLQVAMSHHRMEIIKYLVTEWKHKDKIYKKDCIYHPTLPHMLPTLLFAVLDCHFKQETQLNFVCECIEFLTNECDAIDVGLNWVCSKKLRNQQNILINYGQLCDHPLFGANVLYINRAFCVGTMLSALVYKCECLYAAHQDIERKGLEKAIGRLIKVLVRGGMDWNLAKHDKNIKNVILKHVTGAMSVTDLDEDICKNQDFVKFFRSTVEESVSEFRKIWLDAFIGFYGKETLMCNIFKWHVLDFIVPRDDVLDSVKYFTIVEENKEE